MIYLFKFKNCSQLNDFQNTLLKNDPLPSVCMYNENYEKKILLIGLN